MIAGARGSEREPSVQREGLSRIGTSPAGRPSALVRAEIGEAMIRTLETSNTPEIEPYLDARDAADFLRRSPKTIQNWARSGMIPAHPIGAGKKRYWLFRKSELDKWILAQV